MKAKKMKVKKIQKWKGFDSHDLTIEMVKFRGSPLFSASQRLHINKVIPIHKCFDINM